MPEKIQPVDRIRGRFIRSSLTKPKNNQEQSERLDNKSKPDESQEKPLKKGSTFEYRI